MRWPDPAAVRAAVEAWAHSVAAQRGVVAVGLFGSLARGGWGVGSDVDLVVVLDATPVPFVDRPSAFPADALPVPADVLVYTAEEWVRPQAALAAVRRETRWISGAPPSHTPLPTR